MDNILRFLGFKETVHSVNNINDVCALSSPIKTIIDYDTSNSTTTYKYKDKYNSLLQNSALSTLFVGLIYETSVIYKIIKQHSLTVPRNKSLTASGLLLFSFGLSVTGLYRNYKADSIKPSREHPLFYDVTLK